MASPDSGDSVTPDLDAAFDPTDPRTVFRAEVTQLLESGHDADAVVVLTHRAEATDPLDRASWWALVDELAEVPRSPDWRYEEPEGIAQVLDALPAASSGTEERLALADDVVHDRILAGWLGRVAGCMVGKPVEDGDVWTSDVLQRYLRTAGAWPLTSYVPVLDPMQAWARLREDCWRQTTLGHVDGSARDDDIDYALLNLHLLERHGPELRTIDVARAWLELLPFHQVYTAERAAYRNLVEGVPVQQTARRRNPYREWIGAQIRADAFGWTHPGRPRAAVRLALQDAVLSHTGNGVYGEAWAAALMACAFTATDAREALEASLEHVPPRSRLAEALRLVLDSHAAGETWEDGLAAVQRLTGRYSWIHTVNNAALVALGLLQGDGDVAASIGYTVMGGWDTDSNGATAGSVAGVLSGTAGLPGHLVDPLRDTVRSALFGFDGSRISELAARTTRLALHQP
ncbi:ADP-ribosylglycohydrolase [Quadrisphaera granulorum]|uniref:ADP-ribosylglycohydrolase n=1 Tax=Quadrisphaera granulorum TaxID=317664 RepID=A0A316ASD5_9ACTN|nr:ADP-ribosylglycohydrolase family protein [Quadrisphaera granulorum]PWJ53017.1 ADP-ribosylglycohydrolase [Quadrisphaera granulorum]SZE97182.1 ADP-ribosylglycohydrolase [Quadrisphaera granulorum]